MLKCGYVADGVLLISGKVCILNTCKQGPCVSVILITTIGPILTILSLKLHSLLCFIISTERSSHKNHFVKF